MKRFLLITTVAFIISFLGFNSVYKVLAVGNPHNDKVTICHRTDSVTNPYNQITVDADAADGSGQNDHSHHTGPVATSQAVAQALKNAHIKWGDIIPPHDNYAGLNWTTGGQGVYNNGCNYVIVTPTVTPSVTPTPPIECDGKCDEVTPTPPVPTPTIPLPCFVFNGEFPIPCPTPTEPQVTPTPPAQLGGGGDSPRPAGDSSTTNAPAAAVCEIAFESPKLQGFKALGNGSVEFSWWGVPDVDKYSIIYGYDSNKLEFGIDNISSSSTSITLNGLTKGKSVWAQVWAWKGGCAEKSNILDPKVR